MAILLALVAAVVYGVSDYSGGRATRSAPVVVITLLSQVASCSIGLMAAAVRGDPWPSTADALWSIAGMSASTVAIAAFYLALACGRMTVVAPITAVISAVVPVVVGIAGGERPSVLALVGVVLALVAVALVSATGHAEIEPGGHDTAFAPPAGRRWRDLTIVLAVVAGVGFGLLFVFLDETSDDSGVWPIVIGQFVTMPMLALVLAATKPGRPRDRVAAWLAVAAGAMAVTANISYLVAVRTGLLSLVAVVTSLYPATTVLLATVIDKERLVRPQVVGLTLALGALVMVSAGA